MTRQKTHARPHSRTGSTTSVAKLAALTPAHRQDSAQRIVQPQPSQPPKKARQNGNARQQQIVLQPAQRRSATPPRPALESPSATTEDEWESSESTTVTPNPEPADDVPAQQRPGPAVADDEHGPPTPRPAQKPPLLDMAAVAQYHLMDSPAMLTLKNAPAQAQAPAPGPTPALRQRPHSVVLPAGAGIGMTPLVPEDSRARHRDRQHRNSLNIANGSGMMSPQRPKSVHSTAGFPSRPHPLLRGLSHSGVTAGPLLSSDSAHATLPASPLRPSTGRIFRRPSVSSIKSVATLPATTILSTSPSASSTAATASGTLTLARPRTLSTASSSAALSSLTRVAAGRTSPPPIWMTSVVFAPHPHHIHLHPDDHALDLLPPDARAQHAAIAAWHAPGLASFERVVAARMRRRAQ